jgi:phosphoglycolate phosphatase-like HAD superfamily hydrolase
VRLLLFDIDGTLLTCGGQSKPLFREALLEVFGRTGEIDRYDFSGRTDPRIVLDLMSGAGVPAEKIRAGTPRVRDAYLDRLEAAIDPAEVRVYPGVVDLLETLSRRDDCVLALLTGNWERGAGIKLRSVGLDRYFAFGSFGDDCTDRRMLPPIALERAAKRHGRTFDPESIWILGDSLLDVDCAQAHGLRCLGVATGRTSAADLDRAGATRTFGDFARHEDVIAELLGEGAPAPATAPAGTGIAT